MSTKRTGVQCYDNALPDEPIFCLSARDPEAPQAIRRWAAFRQRRIDQGNAPKTDEVKVLQAYHLALKFEQWRRDHAEDRRQLGFWSDPELAGPDGSLPATAGMGTGFAAGIAGIGKAVAAGTSGMGTVVAAGTLDANALSFGKTRPVSSENTPTVYELPVSRATRSAQMVYNLSPEAAQRLAQDWWADYPVVADVWKACVETAADLVAAGDTSARPLLLTEFGSVCARFQHTGMPLAMLRDAIDAMIVADKKL